LNLILYTNLLQLSTMVVCNRSIPKPFSISFTEKATIVLSNTYVLNLNYIIILILEFFTIIQQYYLGSHLDVKFIIFNHWTANNNLSYLKLFPLVILHLLFFPEHNNNNSCWLVLLIIANKYSRPCLFDTNINGLKF